ncbi:MAG: CocE/NonD family hydrolase [Myxococcota bacterium]
MTLIARNFLIGATLCASLLVSAACGDSEPPTCPDSVPQEPVEIIETIRASDGVELVFTVYRPSNVCEAVPAPLILWNHGFPEFRADSVDDAMPYLDRGYAFVSIDQRGIIGESGGVTSGTGRPGIEDADASLVLDWIHDELPWVAKEPDTGIDKDLVVGSFGNGVGGHLSILLAAFDPRVDAIMPYIAFSSILDDIFAPNEAPRALVAGLFFSLSIQFGVEFEETLLPFILESADTLIIGPELREAWRLSDVPTFGDRIEVPTMFLQPMPDQVLGGLRAAVTNYEAIATPEELKWLVGMNAPFFDVTNIRGFGTGAPSRERPNQCADIFTPGFIDNGLGRFLDGDLVFLFLDAFVKRDPDARARMEEVPHVLLPVEQEGCVRADRWPVTDEAQAFSFDRIDIPQDDEALAISLFTATEPTLIAGDVRLEADVPAGQDEIFLMSLEVVSGDAAYITNDQVYGAQTGRFAGTRLDVRLATPVTLLQPGDELRLIVEGEQFLYGRAGGEIFDPAELTNVVLRVPIADSGLVGDAEVIERAPSSTDP